MAQQYRCVVCGNPLALEPEAARKCAEHPSARVALNEWALLRPGTDAARAATDPDIHE